MSTALTLTDETRRRTQRLVQRLRHVSDGRERTRGMHDMPSIPFVVKQKAALRSSEIAPRPSPPLRVHARSKLGAGRNAFEPVADLALDFGRLRALKQPVAGLLDPDDGRVGDFGRLLDEVRDRYRVVSRVHKELGHALGQVRRGRCRLLLVLGCGKDGYRLRSTSILVERKAEWERNARLFD